RPRLLRTAQPIGFGDHLADRGGREIVQCDDRLESVLTSASIYTPSYPKISHPAPPACGTARPRSPSRPHSAPRVPSLQDEKNNCLACIHPPCSFRGRIRPGHIRLPPPSLLPRSGAPPKCNPDGPKARPRSMSARRSFHP